MTCVAEEALLDNAGMSNVISHERLHAFSRREWNLTCVHRTGNWHQKVS